MIEITYSDPRQPERPDFSELVDEARRSEVVSGLKAHGFTVEGVRTVDWREMLARAENPEI